MPNKPDNIKFSIIICTYNRDKLLPLALNSIIGQSLNSDHFEVLIIDNNSSDSTPDLCKNFITNNPELNVRYITESNQGLSFARNRGIIEASGEILTFMDDDALLAEDFCEKTLDAFMRHNDVSAVGGKILLHFLEEKPFWYNPFLSSLLGYFNHGDKERLFKNTYFRGSNMSFRKSIFESHYPFNTELGRVGKNMAGSEEKEIFFRLKNAGERILYVPTAIVYHLVPKERTGLDFIRDQGIGAGESQRKMVMLKGQTHYIKSIISELIKWFISLLIVLFYFISLRPRIGIVILKFRYWISSGLFSKSS